MRDGTGVSERDDDSVQRMRYMIEISHQSKFNRRNIIPGRSSSVVAYAQLKGTTTSVSSFKSSRVSDVAIGELDRRHAGGGELEGREDATGNDSLLELGATSAETAHTCVEFSQVR